eukprot:TRINITY_DN4360_c0_g2_i12.p1 TRINITY_DN4360_c0_g2~~TRINITY_DN4360_c0_g2_i12.p1  ORF type:complete len:121 (-),score=0.50 TRINITY_DN4360_c0_g2_i12:47-355(-)
MAAFMPYLALMSSILPWNNSLPRYSFACMLLAPILISVPKTTSSLLSTLTPNCTVQNGVVVVPAKHPLHLPHLKVLWNLYPMYSALIPVSYTHLTLPTICSV